MRGWFISLFRSLGVFSKNQRHDAPLRLRPSLEALESRRVLTSAIVSWDTEGSTAALGHVSAMLPDDAQYAWDGAQTSRLDRHSTEMLSHVAASYWTNNPETDEGEGYGWSFTGSSGSGSGDGSGSGSTETSGSASGEGSGYGTIDNSGSGSGDGLGSGTTGSSGSASGDGSGSDSTETSGSGSGESSGSGTTDNSGSGSGDGSGSGGAASSLSGTAPTIMIFGWSKDGNWLRFSGIVSDDEDPSGLTVTFGGLLDGNSSVVLEDNSFVFAIQVSGEIEGSVTAQVTDSDGLASAVVATFV